METVEKRVQLDVDACKEVIDLMNPSPIEKILLELINFPQSDIQGIMNSIKPEGRIRHRLLTVARAIR